MSNYKRRQRRGRLQIAPIVVGILMVCMVIFSLNMLQKLLSDDDEPIIPAISIKNDPNPALSRKGIVISSPKYSGYFNPLYIRSEIDREITRLLFDPLVEPDDSGVPTGILADYEISENGTLYTFNLKNAKFSSGKTVTASDVEFTYHVMLDPSYDGHLDAKSLGIVGAADYTSGKSGAVSGIKVLSGTSISVKLASPKSSAIYILGTSPLSKEYYGVDFAHSMLDNIKLLLSRPMGCGQFVFESFDAQALVLPRNKDYYRGKVEPTNVTFLVHEGLNVTEMLEKGDIDFDLSGADISAAQSLPHINKKPMLSDGFGFLGINCASPRLSDPLVRRAIALAIDKDAIIKSALGGSAVTLSAPLSSTAFSYPKPELYSYDLTKSAELLAEAGYKKNASGILAKDGKTLTLTYNVTSENAVSEAIGNLLLTAGGELGINLKIARLDYGALLNQVAAGTCDLWFMAYSNETETAPGDFFATGGKYNLFAFSSTSVDTIIKSVSSDPKKLTELWSTLAAEMPMVPLYQRIDSITINKRVDGLSFSPARPICSEIYKLK